VPVARELGDGERLRFAGLPELTVLATPGHSRGSLALWAKQEGWLLGGDAVPVPGELPIFDDYPAALASVERLRACAPGLLLSSWQEETHGAEVERRLAVATEWLRQLKEAAQTAAAQVANDPDPLALCRLVAPRLGLPPAAVNPLVARSLAACLAAAAPAPPSARAAPAVK
jgi:glyoxylase-like metal-dependent hydrolase (beta-lactamase superfamily II)